MFVPVALNRPAVPLLWVSWERSLRLRSQCRMLIDTSRSGVRKALSDGLIPDYQVPLDGVTGATPGKGPKPLNPRP